jgi:hypothetical protein
MRNGFANQRRNFNAKKDLNAEAQRRRGAKAQRFFGVDVSAKPPDLFNSFRQIVLLQSGYYNEG